MNSSSTPTQLQAHRNLVQQAYKVFGSHHYDHYDFLLGLSDVMSGIGLEHHRSSEDGTMAKYFKDWDKATASRDLLSHEFTHSWNGKFRRPADLWTPNFNVPMRDSLLWVYEGQTQYWGTVLAARSGLWTKQQGLDALAADAATFDNRAGRQWRPLEDTTNDPITAQRRPIPWRSWQRSEDYYGEGELIWLDADTLIRQKTGGQKSLDDFARAFFGIDDGSYVTVTYTFDDIVHALNAVMPYDWAGFLNTRLNDTGPAPLNGLKQRRLQPRLYGQGVGFHQIERAQSQIHRSSVFARRGRRPHGRGGGSAMGRARLQCRRHGGKPDRGRERPGLRFRRSEGDDHGSQDFARAHPASAQARRPL